MNIEKEIKELGSIFIDKNSYKKIIMCQKITERSAKEYPYLKNKVLMRGSKSFLRNSSKNSVMYWEGEPEYQFSLNKTIRYLNYISKYIKSDFGYIELNFSKEDAIKLSGSGYWQSSFPESLFLFIAEKEFLHHNSIKAGVKYFTSLKNGYNPFVNNEKMEKLTKYKMIFLPNKKLYYFSKIEDARYNAIYDTKIEYLKSLKLW